MKIDTNIYFNGARSEYHYIPTKTNDSSYRNLIEKELILESSSSSKLKSIVQSIIKGEKYDAVLFYRKSTNEFRKLREISRKSTKPR